MRGRKLYFRRSPPADVVQRKPVPMPADAAAIDVDGGAVGVDVERSIDSDFSRITFRTLRRLACNDDGRARGMLPPPFPPNPLGVAPIDVWPVTPKPPPSSSLPSTGGRTGGGDRYRDFWRSATNASRSEREPLAVNNAWSAAAPDVDDDDVASPPPMLAPPPVVGSFSPTSYGEGAGDVSDGVTSRRSTGRCSAWTAIDSFSPWPTPSP